MPKDKTSKTSFRLPSDLWTAVRIEALKRGCDAQDIVAHVLTEFLKRGGSQ